MSTAFEQSKPSCHLNAANPTKTDYSMQSGAKDAPATISGSSIAAAASSPPAGHAEQGPAGGPGGDSPICG